MTEKQTAANRLNAAASTGPRTEEGKSVSAMNALKHGLTAKAPVLPTEDADEYRDFRQRLVDDLTPVGAFEEELVEEIIELSWRLRRACTVEQGIFVNAIAAVDEPFYRAQLRKFEITAADIAMKRLEERLGLAGDAVVVTNEELHFLLEMQLDEAVHIKRTDEGRLAHGFIEDAAGPDGINKLARYETSLFRRRSQLMEMLTTLQSGRAAAQGRAL